ncbi:hypothetical protein AX16_002062 [Volvariella volvacea WC 439]|nr:hypothetical protein AX16_002062 [Volvariella volvacea WC 439]
MPTTRSSSSAVLGKRAHLHTESPPTSSAHSKTEQLQTPDSTPNPKRIRTSIKLDDGESNKENVPPSSPEGSVDIPPSQSRVTRSLRRTTTEVVKSATRSRAVKRHASTTSLALSTPATGVSHLTIATPPPSPPTFVLPIHARAKALLRPTCNSEEITIAGREAERETILNFIQAFVGADAKRGPYSLYISGAPGSGKTALVNSVLGSLQLSDCLVITINCMALNSIDALWERLVEDLRTGAQSSASRSKQRNTRETVETLVSSLCRKCVLLLDELDHIVSNTQSLNALFSLPADLGSNLRLIGIANTHTLTSTIGTTTSLSVDIQTLHFAPYTPNQLLSILQSRLAPLYQSTSPNHAASDAEAKKFLPTATLTLLTKKIAGLTGDVRSLFEVLRGAIDLAITAATASTDINPLSAPSPTVTPNHVLAAMKAFAPSAPRAASISIPVAPAAATSSTSAIVTKVKNLGFQARLALLSLVIASKRLETGLNLSSTTPTNSSLTSTPRRTPSSPTKRAQSTTNVVPGCPNASIEITQLHSFYTTILTRGDVDILEPVSRGEFCDLVGILEVSGLVTMESIAMSSTSLFLSPSKKRSLGRTTSFGPGKSSSAGSSEVRLAPGVWADEVLRGLGILEVPSGIERDARETELYNLWEREKSRMNKELKNIERAKSTIQSAVLGFEDATEG